MRSRVLAILVLAGALQALGCDGRCRCCNVRNQEDRIPPAAVPERTQIPLPPPASPSVGAATTASNNKTTGAYGGTGSAP
jgi:hypothetical protein